MAKKLKGKELKDKMAQDIETILDAGLSVMERENNSDSSNQVNHLTIIGGKRRVDYWPSTNSVYSAGVKGQYKSKRGNGVIDAVRIAKGCK